MTAYTWLVTWDELYSEIPVAVGVSDDLDEARKLAKGRLVNHQARRLITGQRASAYTESMELIESEESAGRAHGQN